MSTRPWCDPPLMELARGLGHPSIRHRSEPRSCWVVLLPVAGDVNAPRHPDALARGDVVEKARQSRGPAWPPDQPAMQPDGHHLGRGLALGVEHVERVLEVGEELV